MKEQLGKPIDESVFSNSEELNEKALPDAICRAADSLLKTVEASVPTAIDEQQKIRNGFELNTFRIWGTALNHLELLLMIAVEGYEDLCTEFSPAPLVDGEFALRVLMDLHARACQVGHEILTLLRSGYPDGANARWRTLYELVVTAHLIAEHGNELAERYIRHEYKVDPFIKTQNGVSLGWNFLLSDWDRRLT